MNPRRSLHLIGIIELVTLVVMLLNMATYHLPALSGILGPLHGLAYTATVVAALLLMNGRHRVWLLALVPGIGGLLAARATPARADASGGGPVPPGSVERRCDDPASSDS